METFNRQHPGLIYKIAFLFAFVSIFTFLSFTHPRISQAASLANFNPGNIISDYTMSNYATMSVTDIDAFLHAHGSCNDTNTIKASWYPSLHYHIEDGHFVCLADEHFAVTGANYGDLLEEDEESQTAAEVIYEVSQKYKINPQVLLVLLEKEQGLISDSWPNSIQFRSATGFGCPDTAPCDSEYYGLKNQLESAAWLFRTVLDGGWTNYPLGENYIHYNPNASCGGSTVYIENLATSSLYRYTPYQPNAAALAAGYGTVTCGAYGNRNFYLFFMDWFGDPTIEEEQTAEALTDFERTVADGFYQLVSASNQDTALDISGGVTEDTKTGDLILYKKKESPWIHKNQLFKIEYDADSGYYKVINPTSNLSIDVKGGSTKDLTPLIMWKQSGRCNQQWLFKKNAKTDNYTIISRCSNKAMSVSTDNKIIITSLKTASDWKLIPTQGTSEPVITPATYQISTTNNLSIDISGGVYNGMQRGDIILYARKEQNDQTISNQLFDFLFDTDTGTYTIKNPTSGLNLSRSDSAVSAVEPNDYCSQRWIIQKQDDSSYIILSSCDNTKLFPNEHFNLIKVSPPTEPTRDLTDLSESATYQITAQGSLSIDISGGITPSMDYGKLIAYQIKTQDNLNQRFKLKYMSEEDAYLVYNPTTNMYLDVSGASQLNDAQVILYAYNGNCNQLWLIEQQDDNSYIIKSKCSDKPLVRSTKRKDGNAPLITISDAEDKQYYRWQFAQSQ